MASVPARRGVKRPKAARGQRVSKGHVVSVRHLIVGDSDEISLDELRAELKDMNDVLLGRVEPPIDTGISTLMEVAEVYHARAKEIEQLLHEGENDGTILKGSSHYKFRTGQLRSFIELTSKAVEMGSRRITALQVELEMDERN